jgi:peptide chain release factor subunit 3
LTSLISYFDKKTRKRSKKAPQFAKKGMLVRAQFTLEQPVCMETFKDNKMLGRFSLRDEGMFFAYAKRQDSLTSPGKSIGIGKVVKLVDASALPDVAGLKV